MSSIHHHHHHVPGPGSTITTNSILGNSPGINGNTGLGLYNLSSEYVLEISNLYYTGHVEPQTWVKQITGTTRSGLILRDVCLEVGSGNIMAILGSKGSGKKALLDVIACRANTGVKKGYVLLNGVSMNRRLFHTSGSYVTGLSDKYLLQELTVFQTLEYTAYVSLNVPSSLRKMRVRQILADIALTNVAGVTVDRLSPSEKRRLAIGVALVKDPVLLLADEPAWNLDPLNTYFIISILSNYAKKYGRIVVLTMEKPRSDIFPFLDRVTYLCLGDVVFSGNTRTMLDYFRNIGFPCPEIENALIYYLCLSTVDRRSHDKFIESSNQISLLVEKFKLEGHAFRKSTHESANSPIPPVASVTPMHSLGAPPTLQKISALIMRTYATTFLLSMQGMKNVFSTIFFLPCLFFLTWIFYFGIKDRHQHVYVSLNGLILHSIAVSYFTGIWAALINFPKHRKSYYQESRAGHYSGPLFILSHTLATIPFNIITCVISAGILYNTLPPSVSLSPPSFGLMSICLFTTYSFSYTHCAILLLTIKSRVISSALLVSQYALVITLSSNTLRSYRSLPDWQYYLTYIMQPRYASAILHSEIFKDGLFFNFKNQVGSECTKISFEPGCRFLNATHYLQDKYYSDDLNSGFNVGMVIMFWLLSIFAALIAYAMPIPEIVKRKFRD
ncbi:unnamed protein product [Orchesella dallaii]|uniref:ABC transporter domain-containing protein n=1 Tax=Orchesella dallaii TaxID=48710 RepID=A0ABP1QMM2_9HEXA